jgi:hypothetical protein
MKLKIIILTLLIICSFVLLFTACSSGNAVEEADTTEIIDEIDATNESDVTAVVRVNEYDVPDEVFDYLDEYMNAYRIGVEASVDYMHFENDERGAYLGNYGIRLEDYQIKSTEKINDNLYEFDIQLFTSNGRVVEVGDVEYLERNSIGHFFVGYFDNKWWYIGNITHIPESISENLDPSKYVYDNPDIISAQDVLR